MGFGAVSIHLEAGDATSWRVCASYECTSGKLSLGPGLIARLSVSEPGWCRSANISRSCCEMVRATLGLVSHFALWRCSIDDTCYAVALTGHVHHGACAPAEQCVSFFVVRCDGCACRIAPP